jgi:hypothetical protein
MLQRRLHTLLKLRISLLTYFTIQVHATDRDDGIDGQIVFSLATPHPYFNVNPSKGTLLVSRSPDTGLLHEPGARRLRRSVQEVRLVLEAKSRRIGSLSSSVQVFVSVDEMALPSRAEDGSAGSVAPWVTGVIVGIVLIVIALALAALFYCRFKRAKDDKERKLRLTGNNITLLDDIKMLILTYDYFFYLDPLFFYCKDHYLTK